MRAGQLVQQLDESLEPSGLPGTAWPKRWVRRVTGWGWWRRGRDWRYDTLIRVELGGRQSLLGDWIAA
jgi:hypothetical protein